MAQDTDIQNDTYSPDLLDEGQLKQKNRSYWNEEKKNSIKQFWSRP